MPVYLLANNSDSMGTELVEAGSAKRLDFQIRDRVVGRAGEEKNLGFGLL